MALPAGTVTFLFSDVEGSTQLARQLGDQYGEALAAHVRVLREAFEAEGGHEVDTQGDSFFFAFARARNAVLAAATAQRALAGHSWPEGCELRVRMGLHTGEAAVTDGRYLGVAVHRAARVCSAGHGGQVLLSQSTTSVLEDEQFDEIELRELGHHQLKDFERPERIFQLVIRGLPADFPPLRAEYHLGRLIDHVHLRVRDLEASKRFYGAVLESLGRQLSGEGEGHFWADELFASDDKEPTANLHVAFQARDRETVHAFYEAALAAGGRDNGAPGERRYHPGYYAAYVLDPDGNNVEAVHHGPSSRSVESVVVTPSPGEAAEQEATERG
jgi:class 3 adenylate cyclase/catechol 2,3-dioxygenase-like lactoylglutathione lyase family enzyme